MNITSCPQCGGRVRSASIGWKCENCNGFIDMRGEFHQHKEEPFMPPMTNADRIRAMNDEELAKLLLDGCRGSKCDSQTQNEYGSVNCFECRMTWLQQPAEEDT